MNRIARLIGLVTVLLLAFAGAVLVSGIRLQNRAEEVRVQTLQTRQTQLERILTLARPGAMPWGPEFVETLNAALDAKVTVVPTGAEATLPTSATPDWQFRHIARGASGEAVATLHVAVQPPATVRFLGVFQRTVMTLLIVALGLVTLLVVLLMFRVRRRTDLSGDTNPPNFPARHEFDSLSHLAKVSVQQGADLERERNERLRAEEDLHFQQVLLNRALEEKIQLGRELHDGIIQSLYATGLTFEAAKNQLELDVAEARRQLDSGMKALNTTIREVRSYIVGLSPENLRQQTFNEAINSLTQTLNAGRKTSFDLRIDDAAAARLSDTHSTHLLQITREAISNALRHGQASHIVVRLHESDGAICLLVQDNGVGFDTNKLGGRGHGLGNIQARAERLSADVKIASSATTGTRIVLTLPLQLPVTP